MPTRSKTVSFMITLDRAKLRLCSDTGALCVRIACKKPQQINEGREAGIGCAREVLQHLVHLEGALAGAPSSFFGSHYRVDSASAAAMRREMKPAISF